MAKNSVTDWDTTPALNLDVGGVGINGTDSAGNISSAFQTIMGQVAAVNAGTAPFDDTLKIRNATDTTKTFTASAENIPTGTNRTIDMNAVYIVSEAGVGSLSNYLSGFTLSNNSSDLVNDIDIAPGVCIDSTNTKFIQLDSSMTKSLDATWVAGSGNGGRDTGSISNGTWHIYAIKNLSTGAVDILESQSASSPTLPTGYTVYRRIGSIFRKLSTILPFSQNGDEFLLDIPELDVDVTTQGTTAISRALTVPNGIKVNSLLRMASYNAANWVTIISSLDTSDIAPVFLTLDYSLTGGAGENSASYFNIRTNTSGEVRTRGSVSSTVVRISTLGWVDTRGK